MLFSRARVFAAASMSSGLVLGSQMQRVRCESEDAPDSSPTLIEQADAAVEADKFRTKSPLQLESLKSSFNSGRVNSFDGLRFAVSKQLNMNTAVSHL
jgi:hypothetical protein